MTQSEKIKQSIIENWFLFREHREPNKQERKLISDYIKEDHANEILDSLAISEDKLGIHTTCQNCGSSTNL